MFSARSLFVLWYIPAHLHILIKIGPTDFPFSVKKYSTLGGISLYCRRSTMPSAISSLRVEARTASVISVISLRISLYLNTPLTPRTQITRGFHLPPKISKACSRGQRISSSFFSFFINLRQGDRRLFRQRRTCRLLLAVINLPAAVLL